MHTGTTVSQVNVSPKTEKLAGIIDSLLFLRKNINELQGNFATPAAGAKLPQGNLR